MTKRGTVLGWQTFETPPPIGVWVDVYCEDNEGTWRIDLGEWTGTSLGSINNPWHELGTQPLLWRPRHPCPISSLVAKAKMLPSVPVEHDEWVSDKSIPWEEREAAE